MKFKEVVYRIADVVAEVNMYVVIVLLILSILSSVCLVISVGLFPIELDHPSDEELIEQYRLYRTQYQQAAELLTENQDLSVRSTNGFCDYSTASESTTLHPRDESICTTIVNYLQLLGVERGYTRQSNVWLTVYYGGLAVSGVEMGYIHTIDVSWLMEEGQIVPDLDECEDRYCFRRIDWGWYIYKYCF